MRSALGENDMMAYLAMMAVRLIELHRVLKPTGSLYLHCDPTASHYLKMLLDAIFGAANFRNEIIWKRTSSTSDAHKGRSIGRYHDMILASIQRRMNATCHQLYELDEEYVRQSISKYRR